MKNQNEPTVRILVAIDVPTPSGDPEEAKQRLVNELQGFRFAWETSVTTERRQQREDAQNEPIHWTGPHPDNRGSRWVADIGGGTSLVVTHCPDDRPEDAYQYRAVYRLWNVRPIATGKGPNLTVAQQAARDALVDHSNRLAVDARRVVSTIKPPKST